MYQILLNNKSTRKVGKTQEVFLTSYKNKKSFLLFLDYIYNNKSKFNNLPGLYATFGDDDKYQKFKQSLMDCGSWLVFNYYYRKKDIKLDKANFCKKDKLCVGCAVRRAYKQQNKFIEALNIKKELMKNDWYYIVIPVKHTRQETLQDVYKKIMKVRRAITKAIRDKKNGRKSGIWGTFEGGLGSIETTKTLNGWNVHLNLLVNARNGSNLQLKEVRNKKGQVSFQNEQIRQFLLNQVESQMHNINKIDFSNENEIRKNLLEVLKYSLKFSSLDLQDLLEVAIEFYKKRLFFTFGNIRGIKLENVELEGDDVLDDEFIRLIFQRVNESYKLHQVEMPDKIREKLSNKIKSVIEP